VSLLIYANVSTADIMIDIVALDVSPDALPLHQFKLVQTLDLMGCAER